MCRFQTQLDLERHPREWQQLEALDADGLVP
jgi:hypothetical protein